MTNIIDQSIQTAIIEASKVWSLVGAQYVNNKQLLLNTELSLNSSLSAFSLSARRVLETKFGKSDKFTIDVSCWDTKSIRIAHPIETDLWDTLNKFIHARHIKPRWEELNPESSYIKDGAKVIAYLEVETDKRPISYINPFGAAHCYLGKVLPLVV